MKPRKFLSFHKKVSIFVIFGLTFWMAGIVISPILAASKGIFWQRIASFMYFFYQPVCHQIADRSFLIDGFTMTVCVRCFAFYLSGFFTSSFYLFRDKIKMWKIVTYVLLISPAILDFTIEKLGFYSNLIELRFLTGFLFGVVVFHLFLLSLSTMKAKPLIQHSNTIKTQ